MAVTSGTVYTNAVASELNTRFYVTWSQTSQSTPNNTTTISWKIYLENHWEYYRNAVKVNSLIIDGTTVYSGGVWSNITTTGNHELASGSTTISHNSDGTKTFSITLNAWLYSNSTLTGTDSFTLTTIPRYATLSHELNARTETTISVKWTANATCDRVWYSLNSGSSWTQASSSDASSGTYTISGLSANTSYSIQTRVRRKDSQLNTTTSTAVSTSTYAYPYATTTPNFNLGSELTITIYNPLSRSVTVYIRYGSTNVKGITTSSTTAKGYNDSTTVNALYGYIPNAKTGTYNVAVVYGSNTATKTGGTFSTVEANCKPSLGSLTYVDTNSQAQAVVQNTAIIVQNKSTPKFTVSNLATQKSATISSVKLSLNNSTYTMSVSGSSATYTTGTIDSSSNLTATVTITDSRGYTASTTCSVRMAEWSNPNAITTLKRKNNFYTETYITVDAAVSSLNGHNTISISYSASASGETTQTGTLTDNVQQTLQCSNTKSWTFIITITDALGKTLTYTRVLPRGIPLMFWDRVKNLVGVNRYPEKYSLEADRAMSARGNTWGETLVASTYIENVNQIGYYTILEVNASDSNVRGNWGLSVDISICRSFANNTNEVHNITFLLAFDNAKFVNERSVTNTRLVTGIRYVRDNSGHSKIQIQYNSTSANHLTFSFVINTAIHAVDFPDPYFDSGLYTVMASYAFPNQVTNTIPVGVATYLRSVDNVSNRLSSADFENVSDDHLVWFHATGSMTNRPESHDGAIMHFAWDNSSPQWAAQLFLGHGADPTMYIRGRNDSSWDGWNQVYDSAHKPPNLPTKMISSAPTDTYVGYFVHVNSAFTVLDGSTSNTLTIPRWCYGIFSATSDASMIMFDASRNLYCCYRNNGTWRGRKI